MFCALAGIQAGHIADLHGIAFNNLWEKKLVHAGAKRLDPA